MNKLRILTVAAHPDDEILGCGGTIARFVKDKADAFLLILGEGITSRDDKRNVINRSKELAKLHKNMEQANKIIGVKDIFTCNLPDNRFDTVPLLDIVKKIEKIKRKIKPDIIFTHFENDLNLDHSITNTAVLTATRPMKGEKVKEIYAFEIISSTEWKYPLSFCPDFFVDITKTIELKKKAMIEYTSELRAFPHPRSVKGIELNAHYWGIKTGCLSAEAFKTLRRII